MGVLGEDEALSPLIGGHKTKSYEMNECAWMIQGQGYAKYSKLCSRRPQATKGHNTQHNNTTTTPVGITG